MLESQIEILKDDENFKFGGVSSVSSPVANIPNFLTFEKVSQLISAEFKPTAPIIFVSEDEDLNEQVNQYKNELLSWNWTFGKSPPFRTIFNGSVLTVENGIVNSNVSELVNSNVSELVKSNVSELVKSNVSELIGNRFDDII